MSGIMDADTIAPAELPALADQAQVTCSAHVNEARDAVNAASAQLTELAGSPLIANGMATSTRDLIDRLDALDEPLVELLKQVARHFEGRDDE